MNSTHDSKMMKIRFTLNASARLLLALGTSFAWVNGAVGDVAKAPLKLRGEKASSAAADNDPAKAIDDIVWIPFR